MPFTDIFVKRPLLATLLSCILGRLAGVFTLQSANIREGRYQDRDHHALSGAMLTISNGSSQPAASGSASTEAETIESSRV